MFFLNNTWDTLGPVQNLNGTPWSQYRPWMYCIESMELIFIDGFFYQQVSHSDMFGSWSFHFKSRCIIITVGILHLFLFYSLNILCPGLVILHLYHWVLYSGSTQIWPDAVFTINRCNLWDCIFSAEAIKNLQKASFGNFHIEWPDDSKARVSQNCWIQPRKCQWMVRIIYPTIGTWKNIHKMHRFVEQIGTLIIW